MCAEVVLNSNVVTSALIERSVVKDVASEMEADAFPVLCTSLQLD